MEINNINLNSILMTKYFKLKEKIKLVQKNIKK
jgi:hypothetical protein